MNISKNIYLQFQVIFSLPLSSPNRGMNGRQKVAPYGNAERALISSQSLKHSIRNSLEFKQVLGSNLHSVRNCHMEEMVVEVLLEKGVDEEKAKKIAVRANDLGTGKGGGAFWISTEEIDSLADGLQRAYETLIEGKGDAQNSSSGKAEYGNKPETWENIPMEKISRFIIPTKPKSLDILGFGRVTNASNAFENVDSCLSVGFAYSTHPYMPFVDEWTVVDTLYPKDGPACMGTTELSASVYYAHLNIHLNKLIENMDGNVDNALLFIRAVGTALFNYRPTDLVTSTAAYAQPDFLVAEVLDDIPPFDYSRAFTYAVESQLPYDSIVKMIKYMNIDDEVGPIPDPQNNRIWYSDLDCEDPLPPFTGIEANNCDECMDRIEQALLSLIEKHKRETMDNCKQSLWWLENLPPDSNNTLFLRLEGIAQAWGGRATDKYRPVFPEPSKSGVVGLLCAALGVGDEDKDLRELSRRITLGTRCDRRGTMYQDFHTMQRTYNADRTSRKSIGRKKFSQEWQTVASYRDYLFSESFLVAVRSETPGLIARLAEAVRHPAAVLYLGRKCCVPSTRTIYDGIGRFESLEDALRAHPWYVREDPDDTPSGTPAVGSKVRVSASVECDENEGMPRHDEVVVRSLNYFIDRYVKPLPDFWVEVQSIEDNPCTRQ